MTCDFSRNFGCSDVPKDGFVFFHTDFHIVAIR